ncbi:AAA family ATPase, partial [Bacteroides sp. CAG:189]|uniref:AAA family ATPase n=1 Tax=Bacteroides sp. CAG:189 TaxID=1262737 RepID=UPI000A752696
FYYVDKTDYIPRLEAYKAPVFLRPRRFGKSLLVSTLAHYYDRTLTHRFEDLFGGTYIGSHPTPEHNRYMIIRYDFSAMVMADNMEGLEQNFNILNRGPVEIMVTHNRDLFGDFQFSTRENATQMLEEVLAYARAHDLPPVYILIDEYDNFTNQLLTSYNDPLYEKVTTADSFLRTFFKVIKKGIGEGSIRTCFCTGVLPVTMDDLTSGYNIAEILTLHPDFINMLGFTHAEADTYLRYVLDDPLYEKVTTADSFLRTFFKVIKAGIGEGSIRTCFCTGVLPVTMDDLTSGYNIAEILTLESDFINMLGFTHAETEAYLRYVLDKYTGSQERYDEIWQLIVNNYDGYRFSPKGEKLFNATILTYFLKKFAVNKGEVPEEMIDENLRTDINFATRHGEVPEEMIDEN